jgi:HAE1 family hydrophobic/amphiphilic exporter-1
LKKKVKNEISELNQKKNFLGKISELFIDRYKMAYLIILIIVFLGYTSYIRLPRESMPDVSFPFATITTVYSGASPEDVESLITDKIESAISELEDVEDVTSTSYLGYSIVRVNFTTGSDMDVKKNLINNELLDIDFPEGVDSPNIGGFATSSIPILRMSINGEYDIFTLTQIAEDIADRISKIDGVGNVDVIGGVEREVHIIIDPIKLNNYGLSLNDIRQALSTSNFNIPLGNEDLDDMSYSIRVNEQLKSIEDINNILLKTLNGELIFLKDIADIVDSHEKIIETASMYIANTDDEPRSYSAVNIAVEREDGADVVGSSERIIKMLQDEKGSLYPDDLTVYITSNQADEVERDLADVSDNAISGLIVVIIVLFLFIGFAESIIVAFVIPMALLSALTVMNYLGLTLNGLSILGLIVSLGLLVDNAIVIMENVDRMRHLGLDRRTASIVGTNQVAMSVMAATVTTIAAFVPLTLIPGTMGDFIKNIPQSVIITISVSFVISLVITPALCSRYLPLEKKSKLSDNFFIRVLSVIVVIILSGFAFRVDGETGIIAVIASIIFGLSMFIKQFFLRNSNIEDSKFIKWYEKNLRDIISSRPKKVGIIILGVLLLVMSIATFPMGIMKIEMFPDDDPTSFSISMEAKKGITLNNMQEIASEVESILFTKNYIESFSISVGGNDNNTSEINVELTDDNLRNKSGFEIMEELREDVKNIPGAEIEIMGFQPGPGGDSYPISIVFQGDDLELLNETARNYLDVLSSIDGVVSPRLSVQEGSPQIQIDINNNKAVSMGLSPLNIASELRNYISGTVGTSVKWNNTEIDVLIKMESDELLRTEQLEHLFITLPNGNKIPMSTVAKIIEVDGLSQISHEDYERVVKVQALVERNKNTQVIMSEFMSKSEHLVLPSEVDMSFGGEAGDIEENFGNLGTSMILAVILVYGILAIQFNSIMLPFVIVMTVPMALIGVIFGLLVTGNNFGFYAFMGLVSLVGIAVNDAIVLVDYINYLRSVGNNMKDAIVQAGKTRLIPVFSTTITTCGGILPLAVKSPYYAQLGFSLIFGLMVATVLTLVLIPIFYSLIEGMNKKDKGKEKYKNELVEMEE